MTSEIRRTDRQKAIMLLHGYCEEYMQDRVEDRDLYFVDVWEDPCPHMVINGRGPCPTTRTACGIPVSENELFIPWSYFPHALEFDEEFFPEEDIRGSSHSTEVEISWYVTRIKCSPTGITVNFDGEYDMYVYEDY